MNYARRNRIEDGLGTNVNFFHLDCLSSEVRLNVDLDVTLTVIANGCYRWLARQLKGFDTAKPKQLYRKFVETGGQIEVRRTADCWSPSTGGVTIRSFARLPSTETARPFRG